MNILWVVSYIFIKYYFTSDTTLFKCYGWYCDGSNKLGGSVMTSSHSSTFWFLVIIEPRSAIFFVSVRQCFQIISFLPYSLLKIKMKHAPIIPVYRESKMSVHAYFCISCSSVMSLFCLLKVTSLYFVQFFVVCGLYAYVIYFFHCIIAFYVSTRHFFSHFEYYAEQS